MLVVTAAPVANKLESSNDFTDGEEPNRLCTDDANLCQGGRVEIP